MEIDFETVLWESNSDAAWVFASVPADRADEIDELVPSKAGFGSVKVKVVIGDTSWETSLFPDKKRETFVLPVKKQVRDAQGVTIGDVVRVHLEIETD